MATRKQRKTKQKRAPIGWFVGGIALGLVGAVVLYSRGFIPAGPEREPAQPQARQADESQLIESDEQQADPRFDFFTVLPEMEVVVPERELSNQAQPQEREPDVAGSAQESFILQVGSFRNAADADQMKARLALLGSVANIQQVNVDGQTWHRVRLGPVQGARAANDLRRQLQSNNIDVLVLKASS